MIWKKSVVSRVSDWTRGMDYQFVEHLQLATANNYNTLTDIHSLQITVTAAQIKSSMISLGVAT
jgi:hypothetical protein